MTSLTTSLNIALSGLNAASTQTEIIANNVANALTPGYASQSVELTSNVVEGNGRGVGLAGITLASDPVTTASRRLSDAETAAADYMSTAETELALAIGTPDVDGSLAAYAVELETAFVAAANDPAADVYLSNLADAARDYADAINEAATDVRTVRQNADADINRMVDDINTILVEIETLNIQIQEQEIAGGETATLVNERDRQIDALSVYFEIKTFPRDNNAVAIYTTSGGVLLDIQASTLEFDPTPIITPDMTLAAGSLSPLTINGSVVSIGTGSGIGQYEGGALAAAFEVRDVITPDVNSDLDLLAEDLILRFEDPAVDPTLAAGDAGLFTDSGGAYDALNVTGLAGRIALNAAVDPEQGGDAWRLRDGINALAQGDVGDSTILDALNTAYTTPFAPPAATGIAVAVSATGFASQISSQQAARQLQADADATFSASFNATLRQSETSVTGVNTDAELQFLIFVEQLYAANAQVIRVIDELFAELLRI
ncbi:MAG: flagellar hook-associated protein FlgK [Pseudomonadota bacterium]